MHQNKSDSDLFNLGEWAMSISERDVMLAQMKNQNIFFKQCHR